jgi:PAS domain S-box-containing protein
MKLNSYKFQTKLTIQFTLFFIVISGIIYFYFTSKFEQDTREKFQYKAQIFLNYFEGNPEIFWQKKFDDKKIVKDLMNLNKAAYLVLENTAGEVFGGINIDEAESNYYIMTKEVEEISKNESVFKVVLPIKTRFSEIGKVYVGFVVSKDAFNLHKQKLLTGLFSLTILFAGMIFTYFMSLISFRPLIKVLKKLERVKEPDDIEGNKSKKRDEIGLLADRIDNVLLELDKSSSQVEVLNKKVHDFIKSKLGELTEEINYRKKAEYSLIKSEEQFRLMFENAPIGMVMLSPENEVIRVNKSFCKMVGYQPDELINMHIRCLIDNDKIEFFTNENMPKQDPAVVDITSEKVLVRRSGSEINVIVKSVPIFDNQKKVKHNIIQVLDISQIKSIQKELINTLEKAKESDRLKSAFLAQMSHEIRTPLNVILTSVPLLADEIQNGDEELKIILDSVRSAGKRLQRTIDMILSMSSVQSGNYKPDYENFDIVSELKNMVNEFRSLAEDKGLQLRLVKHCDSLNIIADKYTVNQIFQNLINNAIKYTPKGFVEVAVIETYNKIRVEIRDSGIGMSPEYMKNLFSPFSQEDAGHKREYEGNGLGLALVKKYIEINSAGIEVDSEKNIGSVFTVTFDKELDLSLINKIGTSKTGIAR